MHLNIVINQIAKFLTLYFILLIKLLNYHAQIFPRNNSFSEVFQLTNNCLMVLNAATAYIIIKNIMFQSLKWFDYLFTIAIGCLVIARMITYYHNINLANYIIKPIPIIIMIVWLLISDKKVKAIWRFTMGLTFSCIGDILLIFDCTYCFYAGGLCFLLNHICYIYGFLETSGLLKEQTDQRLCSKVIFYIIYAFICFIFIAVSAINLYLLWESLSTILKIGLSIYITFLTTMVLSSFSRYFGVIFTIYALGFLGAIFFQTSDFLLFHQYFNKNFFPDESQASLKIKVILFEMFSYYFGQYLIAISAVGLSRTSNEENHDKIIPAQVGQTSIRT